MAEDNIDNEPHASISPLQQMVASCSGAIITSLLVTPLDVIKIRLQAQQKPIEPGSRYLYCNGLMDHVCTLCKDNGKSRQWMNRQGCFTGSWGNSLACSISCAGPFTSSWDAMRKIVQFEGVTSLWSGLPPTLVMAVPATVIYFTSYDQIKYKMGYDENNPKTKHIPLFAGVIARTGAVVVISPLELIRTTMQAQQQTYRELRSAVSTTIRESGVSALMRGLGPTLLRDVPFSALYWFGYEYLKAWQMKGSDRRVPTFTESFMAGAASGSLAALVTLPFDVIKTHRQIELGKDNISPAKGSTSTWTLIRQLYQHKGISALFAGVGPRLMKVAPACAIMISTYEFSKSSFRLHNSKQQELGT